MSTEIYAFVQAQTQAAQLSQPINTQSQENFSSEPGLFESIMTELVNPEEISSEGEMEIVSGQNVSLQENTNFNGSNNFSVINFLANMNAEETKPQNPEIAPENENEIFSEEAGDEEKIFWENEEPQKDSHSEIVSRVKNFIEKISKANDDENIFEDDLTEFLKTDEEFSSLTKNEQQEIIFEAAKDFSPEVKENITKIFARPEKNLEPDENIQPATGEIKSDEPEEKNSPDASEISQDAANLAGLAAVQAQTDAPEKISEPQEENIVAKQNNHRPENRTQVTRENPREISSNTAARPESETQSAKADTNFEKVFGKSENQNENANENFSGNGQQNENNSGSQNFSQARENFSGNQNSSRSRSNDTRRVEANDNDRANSASATRTNSHASFQNFFEGVLTTRRTAAQNSSAPLNLRAEYNFNQSQTLRNGLVNVVRFIRADGLQRANVVIDPPALGRISVELTSGTSGVEASIKVASEQIRQLVQDQLADLRMNLSQQGVQVAEFTVDVQQDNSGSQQQNGGQQGQSQRIIFDDDEDDEAENFRIDLEEGLLYWVA